MAAIRSVIAFGEMGGGSSQSDAEAAYIRPLLPDDVELIVSIPPSLLTVEMKNAQIGMHFPVYRLRRPLYGWSRSGNIWEKHLSETLQNLDSQFENQFCKDLNANVEKGESHRLDTS